MRSLRRRSLQPVTVLLSVLTLAGTILASGTVPARADAAPASGRWFRLETHVHSVFSSDAVADVGVLAATARALDYDAVFLTDHNGGSTFQIAGETANLRTLDESMDEWEAEREGTLDDTAMHLDETTAYHGSRSLRFAATSSARGSLSLYTSRGPLITASPVTLTFALRPERFDPGAGFAFLISLGGDPAVRRPVGYTTANGDVLLGQSHTFAWTIGRPTLPAATPAHRLYQFPLPPPTPGVWTTYTVDVSAALAQLPAAQQPHPYAAFLYPRFLLSVEHGAAALWLDAVQLRATRPLDPAQEFVARTTLCEAFSDESFRLFCALEMGQQHHTIRFDFAITDPSQFAAFTYGTDGIPLVQEGGYPTQLNHPGSTIRLRDIRENRAYDADFLEVRKPEWAALWDELLLDGITILGSWGTDSHETIDRGNPATFVFAPDLHLDTFVRALYEGRSFLAKNTFDGAFFLTLSSHATDPHPARYPVFVSNATTAVPVFAQLTGTVPAGTTIRWIRNGRVVHQVPVQPATTEYPLQLTLDGRSTIVRAELVAPAGAVLAMTQPLRFHDILGLPAENRFTIAGIETPTGRGYNRRQTLGIVDAAWDVAAQALLLTLQAPPGSAIVLASESDPPFAVELSGHRFSLTPTGERHWTLTLRPQTAVTDLVLSFGPAVTLPRPDPEPPHELGVLSVDPTEVRLQWQPSTTQDRPLRYRVLRDGRPLASVGTATSFRDRSIQPGGHYRYQIDAVDVLDQRSSPTAPVLVSVPPPVLFVEDFQSGSLASWQTSGSVTLQERSGAPGNRAARLEGLSAPASLSRTLTSPPPGLLVRFRFQLLDQGTSAVSLLTLADAAGQPLLALVLTPTGRLDIRTSEASWSSTEAIAFGVWYACSLRVAAFEVTTVRCRADDGTLVAVTTDRATPADQSVRTVSFGQRSGSGRFALLLDDIRIVQLEEPSPPLRRPSAWGVSRARR